MAEHRHGGAHLGPDLRDKFAMAALGVMPGDVADPEGIAHDAYAIADAMLRARNYVAAGDPPVEE